MPSTPAFAAEYATWPGLPLAHTDDRFTTSPLTQLAKQVIALPHHILRSLRRVRQGKTDADIEKTRNLMARTWDNFSDYFIELAEQLEEVKHGRS